MRLLLSTNAVAAAAVLCVTLPSLVLAASGDESCDLPDYDQTMNVYSPDKCCVYYGHAGTFDAQAVNGQAYLVSSKNKQPYVPVCSDLGAGSWCINDPSNPNNGTMLTCTAAPDKRNNTPTFIGNYSQCARIAYNNNPPCINSTSFNMTWATGGGPVSQLQKDQPNSGTCTGKKLPDTYSTIAATFMLRYCDHFNKTMASVTGTDKRYFCVGVNYDHILECPTNKIVEKCGVGCVAKIEQDGTSCGKAACAAYVEDDSV
jgi:hypothetical protein